MYVYGSHDRFDGGGFCVNDYVTWSAPVDDLSDWRYEGVIYKKTDDPNYHGSGSMYAPDVCLAPDGKYYLYYAFAPGVTRKSWAIRCAVSDSPKGPFKYHGEVDLFPWSKEYLPFDPAVYAEGGRVWLYYGSAMFFPVLGVSKSKVKGGAVVELDPRDMLTILAPPKQTVPVTGGGVGEHGFFEACSGTSCVMRSATRPTDPSNSAEPSFPTATWGCMKGTRGRRMRATTRATRTAAC